MGLGQEEKREKLSLRTVNSEAYSPPLRVGKTQMEGTGERRGRGRGAATRDLGAAVHTHPHPGGEDQKCGSWERFPGAGHLSWRHKVPMVGAQVCGSGFSTRGIQQGPHWHRGVEPSPRLRNDPSAALGLAGSLPRSPDKI